MIYLTYVYCGEEQVMVAKVWDSTADKFECIYREFDDSAMLWFLRWGKTGGA